MTELKSRPVWVCWKRKEVNGRPTKLPYNPKTGGKAMSNNPATWATYELAERETAKYDGVGFMFADGICGIDIDGADGDPERTQGIIQLMDTYTEYSPSGNGYHIIFKCDLSKIPQRDGKLDPMYYQKNPTNGIECYFSGLTNRYFTYTGEAVNSRDIEDRTEQVLIFLDSFMVKKSTPKDGNPTGYRAQADEQVNQSHNDIIPRMAKKDNKLHRLFYAGDTSGYNSQSEADQALCNKLAWYLQGDAAEIDAAFRQSALCRDKWNRDDYRTDTINKAISICAGDYYRPPGRPRKNPETSAEPRAKDKPAFTIAELEQHLKSKKIKLQYNVISKAIKITGLDPSYNRGHMADILPIVLYDELRHQYKKCAKGDVQDFCNAIVSKNSFNPVLELLESVKWDGRDRLPELFAVLGLTDADRLSKTLVYKWLWQCLSMARNNHEEAYGSDGVLVVVGRQGVGKTSLFRKLAIKQEFFYEGGYLDFRDKDTIIRASGVWITELGELETTLRSDIERLKSHITQPIDKYRKPYGRGDIELERCTSFCATCNSTEFLIDPSGNRRFWTIPVDNIDLAALDQLDVLQLWAQVDAKTKHKPQGFRLTRDEQAELAIRNAGHEKPIKAEPECRDIISLARTEEWTYEDMTISQWRKAHIDELRAYSVGVIGKALTKIGIEEGRGYITDEDGRKTRVRTRSLPKKPVPVYVGSYSESYQ